MSGETEADVSSWTVDTLHAHMVAQMALVIRAVEVGTRLIQEELDRRFAALERLANERRDNARQEDRLLQEEMDRRLASAERLSLQRFGDLKELVLTGQSVARDAVTAALDAAKDATAKAETASEKRFDGVNEFRRTLSDQTATFIPRTEHEGQLRNLADRVTANAERLAALELRLTSRLDTAGGRDTGARETVSDRQASRGLQYNGIGAVVTIISVLISVGALLVTLLPH